MAYSVEVKFIETPVFTRRLLELLTDYDYTLLQTRLMIKPDLGKLIPGGGGIRKMRWKLAGRGKSGGVRVIYYWHRAQEEIWMLFIYTKNETEDLSRDQVKQLKRLVEEFQS